MGSRAVLIVCRDAEAARKRFGIEGEGAGICYTRTGRRFFDDPAMLALQALTYTRLGQRKDALDANARALRVAPKNLEVLYGTARMYALQRDQKQAAAYLAQAVDRRYDLYRIIDMDFYNVRSDQDFLTAITR